jgi:hypothetical protein
MHNMQGNPGKDWGHLKHVLKAQYSQYSRKPWWRLSATGSATPTVMTLFPSLNSPMTSGTGKWKVSNNFILHVKIHTYTQFCDKNDQCIFNTADTWALCYKKRWPRRRRETPPLSYRQLYLWLGQHVCLALFPVHTSCECVHAGCAGVPLRLIPARRFCAKFHRT